MTKRMWLRREPGEKKRVEVEIVRIRNGNSCHTFFCDDFLHFSQTLNKFHIVKIDCVIITVSVCVCVEYVGGPQATDWNDKNYYIH